MSQKKNKKQIELMMDTALNPDMMMYLERNELYSTYEEDAVTEQMDDQQANG